MATKKKTSKPPKKAKKTASKKAPAKKVVKRRPAGKPLKKSAKKKPAPKKAAKKKAPAKKKSPAKKNVSAQKPTRKKSASLDPVTISGFDSRARSEQSGDLQGLSHRESADSESVDELVEEGNAFEAEVVAGVERAGDEDEKEVRTREVPEDDVPGEYLDED
jgi:hypothetical protein